MGCFKAGGQLRGCHLTQGLRPCRGLARGEPDDGSGGDIPQNLGLSRTHHGGSDPSPMGVKGFSLRTSFVSTCLSSWRQVPLISKQTSLGVSPARRHSETQWGEESGGRAWSNCDSGRGESGRKAWGDSCSSSFLGLSTLCLVGKPLRVSPVLPTFPGVCPWPNPAGGAGRHGCLRRGHAEKPLSERSSPGAQVGQPWGLCPKGQSGNTSWRCRRTREDGKQAAVHGGVHLGGQEMGSISELFRDQFKSRLPYLCLCGLRQMT